MAEDVAFFARPGIATPVDFPLRSSGRIMGQILGADQRVHIGALLVLEDARGDVVARSESDQQGVFEFPALKMGCYTLRLEAAEAKRLGIKTALRDNLCVEGAQRLLLLGGVALPMLEIIAP